MLKNVGSLHRSGAPSISTPPLIVLVMGVAGAGKTTVAQLLAERLGCRFLEGDDFHPAANVEKMRRGQPLSDADRLPWLQQIAAAIDGLRAQGLCSVITCSALKRRYREILIGQRKNAKLVYLTGPIELIGHRLAARQAHFMPPTLLESQFAALEPPGADEHPIMADAASEPAAIVEGILASPEIKQERREPEPPPLH
jgi:gluconokinase